MIQPEETLGQMLKRFRINAGLSLPKVGARFGWPNGTFVWQWENDYCRLPEKHIRRLARIYKVNEQTIRDKAAEDTISKIKKRYGV